MIDKLVIKNNKLKMKNKTVANKTKGGLWGSILGIALVAAGKYFGAPIPEELAGEIAVGVVAAVSGICSWLTPPDAPEDIEAVE